ncbi:unnamed protein product [Linum trigynum]|uniref:Uncharacterized protein n=1 Tax=Linum trigynum TaxID=586398 RepID=A0AAV2ETV2_9ROSI
MSSSQLSDPEWAQLKRQLQQSLVELDREAHERGWVVAAEPPRGAAPTEADAGKCLAAAVTGGAAARADQEEEVEPRGCAAPIEADNVLQTMFEILRHHQYFIKAPKCAFGVQKADYLGHIVTPQGVQVDKSKI